MEKREGKGQRMEAGKDEIKTSWRQFLNQLFIHFIKSIALQSGIAAHYRQVHMDYISYCVVKFLLEIEFFHQYTCNKTLFFNIGIIKQIFIVWYVCNQLVSFYQCRTNK